MRKFGSIFICLFLVLFTSTSFAPSKSDIETIAQRVRDELMKPEVDDARIEELVNSLQDDGTWPGIDYKDVSRTGFEHRFHSSNMVQLARAYKSKQSAFYKKKKVKEAVERSLKNWIDHDYFCDNWWYNQIGTPNNLVALMLIIGDELPKELVDGAQPIIQRANINAGGARPGGDRIKIAGIEAKNMLFLKNDKQFEKVIRVIENEIKYVEWIGMKYGYTFRQVLGGFANRSAGGRGIQYDNSFHHRVDGVNNTLSYGLGYADAFVEWAVYASGTTYKFSDEKLEQLVDYFLDGICKTAVYGKYPDMGAKNRSISREGALHAYDASTAVKLLSTTDYRKEELQEIADIRNKGIKPTLSHATFFWHSEHFTFQRPDCFTSVRMFSTRTHNMEQPYNREGLFNHHRGDGTNHISRTGDEYYGIAPVFDYQKIPGATIVQKEEMPPPEEIQKIGMTDFVGAATDGKYGAAAFDFKSPHDPLVARKAWFFFDNEYVCLGTGISARRELPVFTTLNQCLLRDEVTVSSGSGESVLDRGTHDLENIDWVFQDGIGYVFPQPATVHVKNDIQSGSWWRINKQTDSPKDDINLDVFSLWIDHGVRPSDEEYAYLVVPATSIQQLRQQASVKNARILSNTPEVQAVLHEQLGIAQMVFYKAAEVDLGNGFKVRAGTPGILMLKLDDQELREITVADPNRELETFLFSVTGQIDNSGEGWSARSNRSTNSSEIYIHLPTGVYAGSSVTIKLN